MGYRLFASVDPPPARGATVTVGPAQLRQGVPMSGRRLVCLVVAVSATASFLLGCSGSSGGGDKNDSVVIGLEGPITGEQSSNGVDMLRAAMLAASQLNRTGVLGKHIEVVPIDDKADENQAVKVATTAVTAHDLFAVIGPYNSAVGVKNLPTYLDHHVIPIHLTSNSATNGEGFTVQPKDYQIAPIEARAITSYFHAHRVAILYDGSTYTEGIARSLRGDLGRSGVRVVSYASVKPDAKNYTRVVRSVLAKGNPDLVYASTYYPAGGRIADALRNEKFAGKCLMGLANQDPGFLAVAGLPAARDCSFSGVPSAQQFPRAAKYVTAYQARFHAAPGTWGTFTYDSVMLLADAVRRAGAWDTSKVTTALTATRNYDGITGSISIDPSTGNRQNIPVVILGVTASGGYAVDRRWAAFAHFSG